MYIEVIDCAQGFSLDYGETKTTKESSDQAPIIPTRTTRRERTNKFKGKNEEETEIHAKLVLHLSSFGLSPRFAHYLQTLSFRLGPVHLRTLGISELEELKIRVRTAVANKNQTSFFKDSVLGTVKGVELVTQSVASIKSRINLNGWAQALENDDVFLDAIEQLRLTHQDFTALPPHIRLLLCLVQSAARVHMVKNSLISESSNQMSQNQLSRVRKLKPLLPPMY